MTNNQVKPSKVLLDLICEEYGWEREKTSTILLTDEKAIAISKTYPDVKVVENGS
jgi:hypothetical protein